MTSRRKRQIDFRHLRLRVICRGFNNRLERVTKERFITISTVRRTIRGRAVATKISELLAPVALNFRQIERANWGLAASRMVTASSGDEQLSTDKHLNTALDALF